MADPSAQSPGRPVSAPSRPPIPVLVAITATWFVSQLSYYAQPQLLSPIMSRFGRGEEDVGWMYGAEIAAYALTSLVVAGPLGRLSRVGVALFGGAILAAANLASGFVASGVSDSFELLQYSRVMAGVGGALLGSAGTASAASANNPQRVFAIVTFTSFLLIAAEAPLLPLVLTPFGAKGGFFALAGATVIMMPLFVWLLPPPRGAGDERSSVWSGLRSAPNRKFALAAMLALFIYEAGQGAVFMFIAEIGERSSLGEQAVGNWLGGMAVAGLAGALFAAWLGGRFGSRWPIVIGIGGNVLAAAGLALVASAAPYVLMNLAWSLAYYFVVPYLMGVMAEMDDRGRWVVAVDAIWWLGDAAAPAVGGMIVARSGYELLAAFPIVTGVVCIAVFMRLLVRFGQQRHPLPADGTVG
jgi:predicted MFS family arabinose efflux permease